MNSDRRGLKIGLVAAAAVAVVGLVSGVESSSREVGSRVHAPTPSTVAVEARSYRDMRTQSHGPNDALPIAWWRALRDARPDPLAVVTQNAADRDLALARRASRRAFDGAPPGIPHAIDQLSAPGCLSCHRDGLIIAGIAAPLMSHPRHDSCVQCHVVIADPRPRATAPSTPVTTFVGLESPDRGARAADGAPPTIPHTTWMRERCESCHGTLGALGMRSTHPWRQSCTQCHAPSAVLDQRRAVSLGSSR